IGRALINDPALVLADEPTGNLDSVMSAEIMELLLYANRRYNQTLVIITHDERVAMQANRVLRIEDGRITADDMVR
ncbi:MAG: ABC transporter ATP-binding protein, partial [Coriobacteriales bacterium]|nr:ABC transporter ATP-binding protein [Coriobacteriales bacterium]